MCDYRRGLDRWLVYWPLETTCNNSAIANLHNSHFTTEPAKPFSSLLCLSRFLATLLTVNTLELSTLMSILCRLSFRTACQMFPQLNWIAISSQPPLQSSFALNSQHFSSWLNFQPSTPFITTLNGSNRKHVSNDTFIVFIVCILLCNYVMVDED
jgi:hypothetical protein